MSGRAWQAFLAVEPPTVTHNDLEAYVVMRRGMPRAAVRKSDRLKAAEDAIMAALGRCAPDLPLSGPLRLDVRWCFATHGRHEQGEPHAQRPDVDNLCKTLSDCLVRAGVIADDRLVADGMLAKAWADPAGIWVRVEEIERPRPQEAI